MSQPLRTTGHLAVPHTFKTQGQQSEGRDPALLKTQLSTHLGEKSPFALAKGMFKKKKKKLHCNFLEKNSP